MFKTSKAKLITVSFLFLLFSISLPVFITAQSYFGQLNQKYESETIDHFSRAALEINDTLNTAMTTATLLLKETAFFDYITSTYQSTDFLKKTLARLAFLSELSETMNRIPAIESVLFFRSDGSLCGASSNWNYFYDQEAHPFFYAAELEHNLSNENSNSWSGTCSKQDLTLHAGNLATSDQEMNLIYGIRKIKLVMQPENVKTVYILVAIKESSLQEILRVVSDQDSQVTLIDTTGCCLAVCKTPANHQQPDYLDHIDPDSPYGSIIYKGEERAVEQIVYYRLGKLNWLLVKQTPVKIVYQTAVKIRNATLSLGLGFILVATLLYALWASRFTRPLAQITKALTLVQTGDLTVRIPETASSADLILMQVQFNQMLDSITRLLQQRDKNEQEKLQLEIRHLQSQINPHFIYNTITSIRWMATLSGADKVADMLVVLINLLHPIFKQWTLKWTLTEELGFAENYIKLLRLRYGNKVSLSIEWEGDKQDYDSLYVPRLILQPILENSCEHGIVQDQFLAIKLMLSLEADSFVITIKDNGKGFSPGTITRLNDSFAQPVTEAIAEHKGKGIGLININRRLKLHYGPAYGLLLLDEPTGGSCIKVKLGLDDKALKE